MASNTDPSAPPPGFSSVGAALFIALRPKQWTKNALLFASLLFTLGDPHPLSDYGRVLGAFALFCGLSGATYLINDIADRASDRLHPKKRNRPIASGKLPVTVARAAAVLLIVACLTAGYFFLGGAFALHAALYLTITLSYSFYLKNIALLDVMALAFGFVLRASAGAVAIHVEVSVWLLLCTGLLALFLALNKRRAELVHVGTGEVGQTTRAVLADYSLPLLDQMITIVAASCVITYALYTFSSKTGQARHGLMATLPFVLYGLFRYLFLTQSKGKGEAPDAVLLEDWPLRINLALWTLTVVVVMLWK